MIPIFDGHNDTLYKLAQVPDPLTTWRSNPDGHIDEEKSRNGGLAGGFFAIWTPPEQADGEDFGRTFNQTADGYESPLAPPETASWARSHATKLLDLADDLERGTDGSFRIARTPSDLLPQENTVAAILHFEDAAPVASDLSDLDDWYDRGIRSIGIVWSRPNDFGTGVPFRFPSSPDVGPGLTAAGHNLVRGCDERGILIDLAHLNERGFWDVAKTTGSPLVVTHACANALSATARNVTDRQIDAIGESGGVLGVNFSMPDLRNDGRRGLDSPASLIVDHVRYITDRIGADHVAFGSDFDGAKVPPELDGAAGGQHLLAALADAGFNEEEIEKIAFRNWLRIVTDAWNQRKTT